MKQSTKLLSLVLALIMAFSCMTVIGNAALVEGQVEYDSIDDAALTPEQVADLALDLVDDLLRDADMDDIDLFVAQLRFSSIDALLSDLSSITSNALLWGIAKGLLGSIGDLEFGAIQGVTRDSGDLNVIKALLNFIGNDNNSEVLSNAAYGLNGGSGISLGLIGNFLDLGDIGDMLNDIPKMLREMVYDMLVYGSYNASYKNESYPSVEDLGENPVLPSDMDTFDEMVDNAILNLLINPQDYEWEGEGDSAVKKWDKGSVILPGVAEWTATNGRAAAISYISPRTNSLFAILDVLAPFAINDIGINALNNNLKKTLMEAVEIDLNEIEASALPADVATDFEVTKDDGTESYVTYLAYDRMAENKGDYYYTTLKTVTEEDANGNPVLDEEGNEVTYKKRKYYKANMASGNEFASLINWDWEFVGSDVTPTGDQVQLDYGKIKKDYDGDNTASIVEGINDLLALVYDVALTDAVKADFEATVGTGYVTGSNENLMTNVNNIAKYILAKYGELVFGSTSPYAHLDYETQLKDLTTIELIAMIGPGFFEDVMPQIIIPKDAEGKYAFHDGVQIYEFGALVIREFVSDIAPAVNYDEYIFENGDVTSADDRQFKVQGVNQWFNLILNMGLDIGYTYLYNITNFGDTITYDANGGFASKSFRSTDGTLPSLPTLDDSTAADSPYEATRWQKMLDDAIIWAARYVGGYAGTSVIDGFDVTTITNISGPLNKLSYILNKLLPLGFINGYSSTTTANGVKFEFDVDKFLNTGLKGFFEDFDLARVLGLLGRNTASSYNMLDDNNLVNAALNLVNGILSLVFRRAILQDVNATNANTAQSVDAVVDQASLKLTIQALLRGLYASSDAIIYNALPIVGKLIKGWGTEQSFDEPDILLDETIIVPADGDTWTENQSGSDCDGYTYSVDGSPFTITVDNTAAGVWRRYIDPKDRTEKFDQQYRIELVDVKVYNVDGKASTYVEKPVVTDSNAPYGDYATFTFNVGTQTHASDSTKVGGAGLQDIPAGGAIARFDIEYRVYGEDGNAYLNGQTFTERKYVNFTFASDEAQEVAATNDNDKHYAAVRTPIYVPYSNAPEHVKGSDVARIWREQTGLGLGGSANYSITVTSQNPKDGFTMSSVSVDLKDQKYTSYGIRLFDTYTAQLPYGNSGDYTETAIKGSVPTQEAFEAAVPYEKVSTTGYSTSWSVNLASNNSDNTNTATFVLKYYDDEYRDALISLVDDENATMRLEDDYITSDTLVYVDRLLKSANETDDMGTPEDPSDDEVILRETDSTATAWIDVFGAVVADSAVTVDEKNPEKGTYVKDGDEVSVKKVTVLNAHDVWEKYTDILEPALKLAYQSWNGNSKYNFKEVYEALRIATNEVEYLKSASGSAIGNAIDTLADELATSEETRTDIKNFTDYQMYRLNRYNDARDDANYYIGLKNDASNTNVTQIDERFPYTGIEEDDLRTLVDGDDTLKAYTGGTDKGTTTNSNNLITALLEPLSDEEIASKTEWLKNKKLEYAGVSDLDVEMASVYLELTGNRLLNRADDVETKYLEDELTSAIEMIGDFEDETLYEEISGQYSERSWVRYEEAYFKAWEVLDNPTQKTVFDAKYELMCARNELVLKYDAEGNLNEADYSELEALMAQAHYALANQNLYNNTAKELGQVLAELGICENDADFTPIEIKNANGDTIDLFPGSASYYNRQPYSVDDQDIIDDVAAELKEALARLKFKGLNITDTENNAITSTGILVEGNEEEGIEEVTATIANIAKELDADAVKALFKVAASNAGAVDVTVSNDLHYTVDTDLTGFAGTNSVVTFYTTSNGVKIPVATVKVVVNGDINGDGAVDVLDGAYAQLVSTEKGELEGCYLLAGDLSGSDRKVTGDDYGAIVNLIVA